MENSNNSEGLKSEETAENKLNGRWTREEHSKFVEGLKLFGKNWKRIEAIVKTRSGSQIRSHAQKFFNKLERKFENQQYLGANELSESFLLNDEQDDAFTQKAIFLREKQQLRASKLKSGQGQQTSQSESMQEKSAERPREATNPLGPCNCLISCSVYSDIWKYPQQIINTDFISTFVDLRPRPKTTERDELEPNQRKRSFVSCESEELSVGDVVRKFRVLDRPKVHIRK